MPFEPEWVPLNQRSATSKKSNQIHNLYSDKQIFSEAIDLYLDQEWGSLEQSVLYRGLLECKRDKKYCNNCDDRTVQPIASNEVGAQEDEVEEPIVVAQIMQMGKPLKWFRAQHQIQKSKMKQKTNIAVAYLFYHVNETGETYFPRLSKC